MPRQPRKRAFVPTPSAKPDTAEPGGLPASVATSCVAMLMLRTAFSLVDVTYAVLPVESTAMP